MSLGELHYPNGGELITSDTALPIPVELPVVAGWKELPLQECNEQLVALGPFSKHGAIFTSSIYAGEHSNSPYWQSGRQLEGSLMTQFTRAAVAARLESAQQLLPEGHYLIVLDSYRSLNVQGALYGHYYKTLREQYPDWSEAELATETQKYVSVPSTDSTRPSPHNTGGAVDVAIFAMPTEQNEQLIALNSRVAALRETLGDILKHRQPTAEEEAYDPRFQELYMAEMQRLSLVRFYGTVLDFGTPFDYGGEAAAANHYEKLALERPLRADEITARNNRRLLYGVMMAAGLQAYPDEWWHFNAPESQMGAMAMGLNHASYGAIELDTENQDHETMRTMHREGLILIHEAALQSLRYGNKAGGALDMLVRHNEAALEKTGDPRLTYLARAAIIEPPVPVS